MSHKDLAYRIQQIPPAATLLINSKVQAMQQSGMNILNFTVGEPDFTTSERICNAAINAMKEGKTKYTDVASILPLRESISERIFKDYGISYNTSEILVSNGGKQSLYNFFQTILNPNDEVLITAPYWLTYPAQVFLAEAKPISVLMDFRKGFQLDIPLLEKSCTDKTKAIIINSPSNPTGVAYSVDTLKELANMAIRKDLWIVSDDLYYKMTYDGFSFQSIVSICPEVRDRTVIIGGVSKSYAMTGWRIGYALGNKNIISAMTKLQGHMTSNACSIAQYAACEALKENPERDEVKDMVNIFESRKNLIMKHILTIPNIECINPQGAFYIFPKVSKYYGTKSTKGKQITNSVSMMEFLIEEAGVACVPGMEFGADDHIRFSYACSSEQIELGMNQVKTALSTLM